MQMLMKRCVLPDKGAPPESMNRILPPRIDRILLKTTASHSIFSSPHAPRQLPSTALSRRLYPTLKSFFANPPFSST